MKHIISEKNNTLEEDDFGFLEMLVIQKILEEDDPRIN